MKLFEIVNTFAKQIELSWKLISIIHNLLILLKLKYYFLESFWLKIQISEDIVLIQG
jgi:hypothetical protein